MRVHPLYWMWMTVIVGCLSQRPEAAPVKSKVDTATWVSSVDGPADALEPVNAVVPTEVAEQIGGRPLEKTDIQRFWDGVWMPPPGTVVRDRFQVDVF